ncbi:MAG: alpha/beta hydrolase, partial [Saprospiraceae bacterium]
LQSASVEPDAEFTPKIAYWIKSPLRFVFPTWARVATKEKFSHQAALAQIQDGWCNIDCPVWIIHGQADKLIYPRNAEYAYNQLSPYTDVTFIKMDNLGHRLFRERPDTLRYYLLEALNCSGPACLLPIPPLESSPALGKK